LSVAGFDRSGASGDESAINDIVLGPLQAKHGIGATWLGWKAMTSNPSIRSLATMVRS